MKDLTVVMLTANKVPLKWAQYHKEVLIENSQGASIITVSYKPLDWGDQNFIQTEYSMPNIYRQCLYAAQAAKTEFIAMIDDDCLHPKQHFEFRPIDPGFYYNLNRWHLFTWSKEPFYFHKPLCGNGNMIAKRSYIIEALEARVKFDPLLRGRLGTELGLNHKNQRFDKLPAIEFRTKSPTVAFYHEGSIDEASQRRKKYAWPVRVPELYVWGRAEDLIKKWI